MAFYGVEEIIESDFCLFEKSAQRRSLNGPVAGTVIRSVRPTRAFFQADVAPTLTDHHKAKPDQGGYV